MDEADEWKDKWDNTHTIRCPKCGEVARRVPVDLVERSDEVVNIQCQRCTHHFDYPNKAGAG